MFKKRAKKAELDAMKIVNNKKKDSNDKQIDIKIELKHTYQENDNEMEKNENEKKSDNPKILECVEMELTKDRKNSDVKKVSESQGLKILTFEVQSDDVGAAGRDTCNIEMDSANASGSIGMTEEGR